MKTTTKFISVLVLLAFLLLPASPALAKGPFDGGPVIFGGNYTLASGDSLNSDLVVFGGNVTIEKGALVKGSIVVFGGNVTVDGTVQQDLVLIGGSGSMGEQSVVEGDLVTIGGSFRRAEGARVEGTIRNEPTIEIPAPTVPQVNPPAAPKVDFNPVGSAFNALFSAIAMGVLAMLLILFLHPQMDRVSRTAFSQPVLAGGAGLLVIFAIPVMVITLILIPVALLAVFLLALAWLLGISALGMEVGERFTRAIGQSWAPALSTGFGTFLLMLVVGGIGLMPCVGWMAPFLVGLVGVGAAALTLFGSREYPLTVAAPAAPVAPVADSPQEPIPPAS